MKPEYEWRGNRWEPVEGTGSGCGLGCVLGAVLWLVILFAVWTVASIIGAAR